MKSVVLAASCAAALLAPACGGAGATHASTATPPASPSTSPSPTPYTGALDPLVDRAATGFRRTQVEPLTAKGAAANFEAGEEAQLRQLGFTRGVRAVYERQTPRSEVIEEIWQFGDIDGANAALSTIVLAARPAHPGSPYAKDVPVANIAQGHVFVCSDTTPGDYCAAGWGRAGNLVVEVHVESVRRFSAATVAALLRSAVARCAKH